MEKDKNIETKKVVIYARYSCSKQNETSIEAQLKVCYEYCKSYNFTVIDEYIDEARSGRNDNRPNFLKMINDSNKKQFEGIVCYQLDRFARNRYDSANYKSKLKKNGVKVYSAKENISDDASGILVESVLEGMAEYYSAELSQKINRNMELNAEKGYFNGGYVPLGYKVVTVNCGTYKKKKLELDPITSKVVKKIYEMRAEGTKIEYIIDWLNHEGYKNTNGKEFVLSSLSAILKNKKYIGINSYGDKEYPNTIPPILDEQLFNSVQAMFEENRIKPGAGKAKEEYILTSKLICDCCGRMMKGVSGKGEYGNIYRYYTCKTKGEKKKCKRKYISKDIENIIVKKCKELLNDENIDMIAKKVYDTCKRENYKNLLIKEYEKQVITLEKSIDNLLVAIENGTNIDLINKRLTEKREELDRVNILLAKEKNKMINIDELHIKFFLNELKKGNIDDITYRKKLIKIFVSEIHLKEKELVIVFNVSKQKISLSVPTTDKENTLITTDTKSSYQNVLVIRRRLERPTHGLEGRCSIQLSYRTVT